MNSPSNSDVKGGAVEAASNENRSAINATVAETDAASTLAKKRAPGIQVARWIKRLFWFSVIIICLLTASTFFVYQSTQRAPKYYSDLIERPTIAMELEGDRFESKIFDVQNEIQADDQWTAVFTEDEINGWLAVDGHEKFPELFPPFCEDPRLKLFESEFRLMFRYRSKKLSALVEVTGDVFVSQSDNSIALQIKHVKSGLIPIPIANVADEMTTHLRSADIGITWSELEGRPLALISAPAEMFKLDRRLVSLHSIRITDGHLEIAGHANSDDSGDEHIKD